MRWTFLISSAASLGRRPEFFWSIGMATVPTDTLDQLREKRMGEAQEVQYVTGVMEDFHAHW